MAASAAGRVPYGGTATVALPGDARGVDPALAEAPADLLRAAQVHQPPLGRGADGALVPVLLEAVPASADARVFRLVLRESLVFHDGTPLGARELADALLRLGDGAVRSPHAALVLPVAQVAIRSAREVEVRLAYPYPRWPEALAELGLAPVGPGGAGAGPFVPARGELRAFRDHAAGRPFLDSLRLAPAGAPVAADLGPGAPPLGDALASTHLFVSRARPDARALAARIDGLVDRAELVRFFVPGAAAPQTGLLPPALDPEPLAAPAPRAPPLAGGGPLSLRYDPEVAGHRAAAERIQLRLHDAGIELRLEPTPARELRGRLAGRDFDLALAQVIAPADPGLAAAAPLALAGERDVAALLLRDVGAAGLDRGRALQVARARAASIRPAVPVVPLWAAAIPAGLLPGSRLEVPRPPAPVLAPSLGDAFLRPPGRAGELGTWDPRPGPAAVGGAGTRAAP